MVQKGNILFWLNQFKDAKEYYSKCIEMYPGFESALFNLGRCYIANQETSQGVKYISDATQINHDDIESFLNSNDQFFSVNLPPNRKLVPPFYTPGYFWLKVFPLYGNFKLHSADDIWGVTFLGLSPLYSFILSILLYLLLQALDNMLWKMDRLKKVDNCSICGIPICRKCKKGFLCKNCFSSIKSIRNRDVQERIKHKLFSRKQKLHNYTAHVLSFLIPGFGPAMLKDNLHWYSVILIALTSLIYASYSFLINANYTYPLFLNTLISVIFPILALYNILFIFLGVKQIIREKKKEW